MGKKEKVVKKKPVPILNMRTGVRGERKVY